MENDLVIVADYYMKIHTSSWLSCLNILYYMRIFGQGMECTYMKRRDKRIMNFVDSYGVQSSIDEKSKDPRKNQ
jgi:hypothetical protein